MSDDKKKFTHQELEALLQRGVTLQAKASERSYTIDDVVGAARELGLDPSLVRRTAEAHLERRETRTTTVRPFDTRLIVQVENGTLTLVVPPVPFRGKHLAPLGFIAFWCAFITFWTTGAAKAGGLFAAFSIPFWLAGIGMLGRFGLPLLRETTLTLGPSEGQLTTRPFGRTRRLRVPELNPRIGDHTRYRHEETSVRGAPATALLLEHGTETIALLDGYSPQEQRWVLEELQAWLPSRGAG
jgi:hypothetical protein